MNIKLEDIKQDITRAVKIALEEDIGTGDITAELIPEDQTATATVITREDCVVCGQAWFDETFHQLGGLESIEWHVNDGDHVKADTVLVTLTGNTRRLLTGERTALNFLQLLSGTATTSAEYAKLVEGTNIKILDTRKTIPGLRTAQKYAVATGGCFNHRIGLYDAFLIKENHIAACGGIKQAVERAIKLYPQKKIEVEIENLNQLQEALIENINVLMLDNFPAEHIKSLTSFNKNGILFELSGNFTRNNNLKEVAAIIDFISSGDLTKRLNPVDLSMRLLNQNAIS